MDRQRRQFTRMRLIRTLLAVVVLGVLGCSSGSPGTPENSLSPTGGSVTLIGSVSGTVIKVLNANTKAVLKETDTASQPGPPPFPFSLSNIPAGVPIKVFFFSAGEAFPLYVGSPSTNVFTLTSTGPIDLGQVTMEGGRATPFPGQPPVGSIQLGKEDTSPPPPAVIPPTAEISVVAPNNGSFVQGPDVPITFATQNFTISNQNQAHLHAYLDNDPKPYEFFDAPPVLHDGMPATNAEWQSTTTIRFLGLSVAPHRVRLTLATASHTEFIAPGIAAVDFSVQRDLEEDPGVSITSPIENETVPFGPVTVSFNVANFTILGQGQLHFYLDGNTSNLYQFLNGSNQVLLNGIPAAQVEWLTSTAFRFTALAGGPHSLRLVLASGDSGNTELTNSSATDIVHFSLQAPPNPSIRVTSGVTYLSSPAAISFEVTNFTVGLSGTPHLRFSFDSGPAIDFYNGLNINSDNGALLNGRHTHTAHWISPTSFNLFALAAGSHQVRLVLVDGANNELTNPEASIVHQFAVLQPSAGELQLEPVLTGLNFPIGLAQAPDGRVFYGERLTGAVRVARPGSPWGLDAVPFCSVSTQAGDESGLLGLAVDPSFSSNGAIYVYYTTAGGVNRISRLTNVAGVCNEIPVLPNIPHGTFHNGGIIQFGPDSKLYAVVGDTGNDFTAVDLDSLAGKIIRMNSNGSAPLDNPFYNGNGTARDLVWSYGHRNSYGFTFHPQTGDLWESENGPDRNDEVNRVVAGRKYGWPFVTGFETNGDPSNTNPVIEYRDVIAPTGIVVVPSNSTVYPEVYRNNLLMAVYNDGTIRLVIPNPNDSNLPGTTSVAYPGGLGGLLSLMVGQDGYVYATSVDGIFRAVQGH